MFPLTVSILEFEEYPCAIPVRCTCSTPAIIPTQVKMNDNITTGNVGGDIDIWILLALTVSRLNKPVMIKK